MGTAIKNPVPGRVEPPFVIFDIRAFWRSGLYNLYCVGADVKPRSINLSVRVPGCQKLQMTA